MVNDIDIMFKKLKSNETFSSDPSLASVARTVVSKPRGHDAKAIAEQKADMAGEKWRANAEAIGLKSSEFGGPKGLEPTRYGDWERAGRCIDF